MPAIGAMCKMISAFSNCIASGTTRKHIRNPSASDVQVEEKQTLPIRNDGPGIVERRAVSRSELSREVFPHATSTPLQLKYYHTLCTHLFRLWTISMTQQYLSSLREVIYPVYFDPLCCGRCACSGPPSLKLYQASSRELLRRTANHNRPHYLSVQSGALWCSPRPGLQLWN